MNAHLNPAAAADESLRALMRDIELGAAAAPLRAIKLDRRSFLKLTGMAGGGLVLAFCSVGRAAKPRAPPAGDFAPNAFLRISRKGSILIYSKGPEIGQGIKTAFPLIIAEELDAKWSDVRGRAGAGESRRVRPAERRRLALDSRQLGPAAHAPAPWRAPCWWPRPRRSWKVPVEECSTRDSAVWHGKRKLGYGALAAKAAALPVPDAATRQTQGAQGLPAARQVVHRRRQPQGRHRRAAVRHRPATAGHEDSRCTSNARPWAARCAARISTRSRRCPACATPSSSKATARPPRSCRASRSSPIPPGPHSKRASNCASNGTSPRLRRTAGARSSSAPPSSAKQPAGEKTTLSTGADRRRAQGRRENRRGFLHLPVRVARAARAAELHGLEPRRHRRVLVADADRGSRARDRRRRARRAGREDQDQPDPRRRRLRPAPHERLHLRGRRDRAALRGTREAGVDARAGHGARLLPRRADSTRSPAASTRRANSSPGAITSSPSRTDGKAPSSGGDLPEQEFPAQNLPNYQLTQTLLPLKTPMRPVARAALLLRGLGHPELPARAVRGRRAAITANSCSRSWASRACCRAGSTPAAPPTSSGSSPKKPAGAASCPPGMAWAWRFTSAMPGHFAEVAEVSVDANKRIRLHRMVVAGDIGPIVNMSGANNQCEGGVVDGFSTMLGLEITMENGRIEQSNFHQYPILRMAQPARRWKCTSSRATTRPRAWASRRCRRWRRRSATPSTRRSVTACARCRSRRKGFQLVDLRAGRRDSGMS